ncbi:hypothetical protein [Candidatus Enterococcus leclercqii]|uniref:hypothetical protein n=1 Tax=Candidatus Enterococcus leclercqii TaxID=1857218 RepID=UPI00137B2991|nr:hypothetical protein [Enterococcus sp. CU9D]KAF1290822.1 hypothetical protein BAU14_08615 [Enterococcus sp. CU9D]
MRQKDTDEAKFLPTISSQKPVELLTVSIATWYTLPAKKAKFPFLSGSGDFSLANAIISSNI